MEQWFRLTLNPKRKEGRKESHFRGKRSCKSGQMMHLLLSLRVFLSIGRNAAASKPCKSQARVILTRVAVRGVIFKVVSNAGFTSAPQTSVSLNQICQLQIHEFVVCVKKRCNSRAWEVQTWRLHPPPRPAPTSSNRRLVNQCQMKGESELRGSCQRRVFFAEGDNS